MDSLFECSSHEHIEQWLGRAALALRREKQDETVGAYDSLISSSAAYRMNRKVVSDAHPAHVESNDDLHPPAQTLPDRDSRAMPRTLSHAFAWLTKRSTCTRCQQEYANCPHSIYLDDQVQEEVTEAELVCVFWTDRPL